MKSDGESPIREHVALICSMLSLVLLRSPALQAEVRYTVIDLGTLGGFESQAFSLNDNGQVVGGATNSSFDSKAALFDSSGLGNNIDLGTLGGSYSLAYSINNNGQIVGHADLNPDHVPQVGFMATLFDPTGGGKNINLGLVEGRPAEHGSASSATSINDYGWIVGGSDWYGGFGSWQATLFDPSGAGYGIYLGALQGYQGLAWSINNSGQIVGRADIDPSKTEIMRATLFDPSGGFNNIHLGTLSDPENLLESEARSINDNGQIVGRAERFEGFLKRWRATLFDPSGNYSNIDLGTLGGSESWAWSINNKGEIVGWAQDGSGTTRATFFDPTAGGNNIDLNTLIDPGSWSLLQEAACINNNGWICGWGINPDGYHPRAFLLVPTTLPPPPPEQLDIDCIGIASSKAFRAGVPESAEPWFFSIWVKFVYSDGIHHIDLTKPGDVLPFGTISYNGDDVWHWGSEEHYSSLAALRADYPLGTYKLELQDVAHTTAVTLNLDYSDLPAEPAGPVNFTYPSVNGQTEVIGPTLTWTVGSTDGDALWRELEDYSSISKETVVDFPIPMSTTSWTPGLLHGGHEYNLTVGVFRIKDWVGPDLPIMSVGTNVFKYAFGIVYMNEIDFSTGAPSYVQHDWNGDGIVSIVGDVPPFVNCVYFSDCPAGLDTIGVGDCSGDGILSIVGDVPCFVDCVYFGNCPQ